MTIDVTNSTSLHIMARKTLILIYTHKPLESLIRLFMFGTAISKTNIQHNITQNCRSIFTERSSPGRQKVEHKQKEASRSLR